MDNVSLFFSAKITHRSFTSAAKASEQDPRGVKLMADQCFSDNLPVIHGAYYDDYLYI